LTTVSLATLNGEGEQQATVVGEQPATADAEVDRLEDGGAVDANCAGDGVGFVAAMMQTDPKQGEPVQNADLAVAANAQQPIDDMALTGTG
jgi:hypothetical protein